MERERVFANVYLKRGEEAFPRKEFHGQLDATVTRTLPDTASAMIVRSFELGYALSGAKRNDNHGDGTEGASSL